MREPIYVTTSIPYVNASPHVGHALELVQADALARYYRLRGHPVLLQTGTDENAYKNVVAAREAGIPVEELVARNSERFRELAIALGVQVDSFIRTTERRHRRGVLELWSRLKPQDMERRRYEGMYCVGCEDFLAPKDLVDGRCPDHRTAPQKVSETNHFFRLSGYQVALESLIERGTVRVVPAARRREVLAFIREGLTDISVSRDAARMGGWGIFVPGDESQTIYVWIDALMNYVTGLTDASSRSWDWLWNEGARKIHVIGKNVWKFHAVYWPALLLSAGLALPDEIVVHGFLTVEGQKISKSVGNAVDPLAATARHGSDSLRCYLLSFSPFVDGDYSEAAHDRLHESRLSSGIGNLVARLTALCERGGVLRLPASEGIPAAPLGYHESMASCRFDRALEALWAAIALTNQQIDASRPWDEPDSGSTRQNIVRWAGDLRSVAWWLGPFMPEASARIQDTLGADPIRKGRPLFPRISDARS